MLFSSQIRRSISYTLSPLSNPTVPLNITASSGTYFSSPFFSLSLLLSMVLQSITNVQVLSYFFIGLSGFGVVDITDEAVDTVVTFEDAGLAEDVVGADVKTCFSVGFEMSAAVDDVDATEVIAVVSGFSLSGKVCEEVSVTVVAGVV